MQTINALVKTQHDAPYALSDISCNKPYWHLNRYYWFTCKQTIVRAV